MICLIFDAVQRVMLSTIFDVVSDIILQNHPSFEDSSTSVAKCRRSLTFTILEMSSFNSFTYNTSTHNSKDETASNDL